MVGEPGSLSTLDQGLEPAQVLAVQRLGRAKVHRDTVLHGAIALQNLIEHFEWAPAIDHEVFRDDLKPVDDRFLFEDVIVMGYPQADADTVIRISVKAIRGHGMSEDQVWRKEMEDQKLVEYPPVLPCGKAG